MEDQILGIPKNKINNKRKNISSKLKQNSEILPDKEKTVDSGEETNKQKLSDNLDILDISEKVSYISVCINSKKRSEISSAVQCNIDIVEDKDKSPTSDEPILKSSKGIKNIKNSDYYQKTKEKRKKNYQDNKDKITEDNKLKKEERKGKFKTKE